MNVCGVRPHCDLPKPAPAGGSSSCWKVEPSSVPQAPCARPRRQGAAKRRRLPLRRRPPAASPSLHPSQPLHPPREQQHREAAAQHRCSWKKKSAPKPPRSRHRIGGSPPAAGWRAARCRRSLLVSSTGRRRAPLMWTQECRCRLGSSPSSPNRRGSGTARRRPHPVHPRLITIGALIHPHAGSR